MKRIIIQIVAVIASLVLAYLIWDTIQTPINFEKEKDAKYEEVIENLKDIRKAQLAFKDVNAKFCGDWDSLISFVKFDSVPKIRKIGMLTDSMIEAGLNERTAMSKGLIIRDTIRASVLAEVFDSLYPIDELNVIPNSGGQLFWLGQTIITTGSGVKVPVFEARAHNNQVLLELSNDFKQEIINLNERRRKNSRYPGLKVGSVIEPNNNAGNWE
ncbi:MAG: hypothetical protein PF541_03990 [Prolixibacteraceae bacterium]|jgi:hypothetical protein|nr:hypothetical protein [Prolixibacteraceae bacterium]